MVIHHIKFSRVLIWRSLESLTKVNVLIFQTGIFCRKAKSDFDGIDDGTAVAAKSKFQTYFSDSKPMPFESPCHKKKNEGSFTF